MSAWARVCVFPAPPLYRCQYLGYVLVPNSSLNCLPGRSLSLSLSLDRLCSHFLNLYTAVRLLLRFFRREAGVSSTAWHNSELLSLTCSPIC